MSEIADYWRENTPIDGPVYDLGGDCYGCRHPSSYHVNGELGCECCMNEHVHQRHGGTL